MALLDELAQSDDEIMRLVQLIKEDIFMAAEIILYILIIMIFYDFSLHLLEFVLGIERARKIKYYWPSFLIGKRRRYTVFWTTYWGTAFILVLFYMLTL